MIEGIEKSKVEVNIKINDNKFKKRREKGHDSHIAVKDQLIEQMIFLGKSKK